MECVVPHGTARVGTNTWFPSPLPNNIDQCILLMEKKGKSCAENSFGIHLKILISQLKILA